MQSMLGSSKPSVHNIAFVTALSSPVLSLLAISFLSSALLLDETQDALKPSSLSKLANSSPIAIVGVKIRVFLPDALSFKFCAISLR